MSMYVNGFKIYDMINGCSEEQKQNIMKDIKKDAEEIINGEAHFGHEAFILRIAKN